MMQYERETDRQTDRQTWREAGPGSKETLQVCIPFQFELT